MDKQDCLSRIIIEGFRSVKKCNIELKKINVLIGGNGVGKSNLLSALSFLQDVNKHLKRTINSEDVRTLLYTGREKADKISVKAFFGDNSYGFDLVPTEESVVFSDEYVGSSSTIDGILTKQNYQVYHFSDTANIGNNSNNNTCLSCNADNLAAFLCCLNKQYIKQYNDIVETICLIAPYFDGFVFTSDINNSDLTVMKWKQNNSDNIFNLSQLSDGTLRFICLATLLLQPTELQPPTIIIDEPELSLHPSAITVLAAIIKSVSMNRQIILSTQSVDLMNEFQSEDIIVVENGDDGTVFSRLNSEQLASWLDEYSLGDLWLKNVLGGRP